MAVNNIQVGIPGGYDTSSQTRSVGLLQNAISDIAENKDRRRTNAMKALKANQVINDKATTRNVLQDTKKNTVMEDFQNRFDNDYASIFNPDGSTIAGQEANAKSWNQGGFGDSIDQTEQDNLLRLSKGVDDAGRYSNDVYDEMLARGLSPEQAEAQRKTQLARWKAPEMSKEALQRQKILTDTAQEKYKAATDMGLKINKKNESNGGNIIDYDPEGNPIYGTKSGSRYKGNYKKGSPYTAADFDKDFGGRTSREGKPGMFTEFIDRFNFSDADDVYAAIGPASASGASKSQITKALSMNGSVTDAHGEAPRINQESFNANMQKILDEEGAGGNNSYKKGKGSYRQGSFGGYDNAGKKSVIDTEAAARKVLNDEIAQALNTGNKPGKKAVLDSIFDWKAKPTKKNEEKVKKEIAKSKKTVLTPAEKAKKAIIDKDREIRNTPTKISPPGTFDIGVDPSKVEVPNPALAPEPGFDQRVIQDADTPWYKQNLSIAGRGRDTKRTPGLQSSNFKLRPNPYGNKKEEVLPSIDSGSKNQRIIDAQNKGAVRQFNMNQDERIKNAQDAKQNRNVMSIVNSNQSDAAKAAALREFTGGIQEAYALLAQMKNQVLK